ARGVWGVARRPGVVARLAVVGERGGTASGPVREVAGRPRGCKREGVGNDGRRVRCRGLGVGCGRAAGVGNGGGSRAKNEGATTNSEAGCGGV
ncbi:hypothetical protein BC826DRAFT_989049, partial [Russula brevipes]